MEYIRKYICIPYARAIYTQRGDRVSIINSSTRKADSAGKQPISIYIIYK